MSSPVTHPAQPRTERIARLLASNDPPLDIEEQTYRVVITQGQTRLIEIDEQIADMRAALGSLLLQRDQLQTHINDHKAVMNPMRRLPVDILSVIFALHAPPVDVSVVGYRSLPHDSLDAKNGPWTLGRVCHRWRSVAEELPILWSGLNVVLDLKCTCDRPLHHSQYLLGRHLRNAKNVPLSIGLFSVEDLKTSHPLLHALAPCSDQWKNLRVVFTRPSSFRSMTYFKGQLNSLKSLYIGGAGNTPDALDLEPCDAFSFAPQLCKLAVTSIAKPCRRLILPWSQITTYSWSRWSSRDVTDTSHHIAVLQLMPNLEECVLEVQGRSGGPMSTHQLSARLPRLRKLRLVEVRVGGTPLLDLLARICAPALQDLEIEHTPGHNFEGIAVLKDFIVRSACPLVDLCLPWDFEMTDRDLLQLLHDAPTLEKINITSDVFSDHLIEQLTYSSDGEASRLPVAPNLHTILIKNLAGSSIFTPDLFFGMVASRWGVHGDGVPHGGHMMGPVARLRSIELIWYEFLEPLSTLLEDPRFDIYRSEGLHIVCACH